MTDRGCLYWRWDVVQPLVLAWQRPFGNHEWIAQGYILPRDNFVVVHPSFGCSLVVVGLGYPRERWAGTWGLLPDLDNFGRSLDLVE